jgi:hypothetical protein
MYWPSYGRAFLLLPGHDAQLIQGPDGGWYIDGTDAYGGAEHLGLLSDLNSHGPARARRPNGHSRSDRLSRVTAQAAPERSGPAA